MPWRENKGVCQFKRILDGNKIFNKNLFCVLRVLSVFRGFLVAYGKKSLEEIFNEIWPLARNNHRNLNGY